MCAALVSLDSVDVVVIGADSRAGRSAAVACAAAGARLWAISTDPAGLHETVDEVVRAGGKVDFRVCDLTDESELRSLVLDLRAKTPRLEVIIDATGLDFPRAVLFEGFRRTLAAAEGSVVVLREQGQGGSSFGDLDQDPRAPVPIHEVCARHDGEWGEAPPTNAVVFLTRVRGGTYPYPFDATSLGRSVSEIGPEAVLSQLGAGASPHFLDPDPT